jgi:hypothetical protein
MIFCMTNGELPIAVPDPCNHPSQLARFSQQVRKAVQGLRDRKPKSSPPSHGRARSSKHPFKISFEGGAEPKIRVAPGFVAFNPTFPEGTTTWPVMPTMGESGPQMDHPDAYLSAAGLATGVHHEVLCIYRPDNHTGQQSAHVIVRNPSTALDLSNGFRARVLGTVLLKMVDGELEAQTITQKWFSDIEHFDGAEESSSGSGGGSDDDDDSDSSGGVIVDPPDESDSNSESEDEPPTGNGCIPIIGQIWVELVSVNGTPVTSPNQCLPGTTSDLVPVVLRVSAIVEPYCQTCWGRLNLYLEGPASGSSGGNSRTYPLGVGAGPQEVTHEYSTTVFPSTNYTAVAQITPRIGIQGAGECTLNGQPIYGSPHFHNWTSPAPC